MPVRHIIGWVCVLQKRNEKDINIVLEVSGKEIRNLNKWYKFWGEGGGNPVLVWESKRIR